VKSWEVYVDNFIGMVQGSWTHCRHVKRVLLQILDKVFCPLGHLVNEHCQDPASIKKMKKGGAYWATRKGVLGWIIDTVCLTIELPAHRLTRLFDLLHAIPLQQRGVSTKKWQKLVGELRSMVIAIPGGKVLFSVLQHILKVRSEGGTRLRLTAEVHTILKDFGDLALDLGERPTRIAELIHSAIPATLGAQDAASPGMDGVHFVPLPDGSIQPMIWRSAFPLEVQRRLVSFDNPAGTNTNSNLEMAASVAQHDVLTSNVDAREATVHNFSDNTPTVFWQRKDAVSNYDPNAQLLRVQALHQRKHRYVPTYNYLPGPANLMAESAANDGVSLTHSCCFILMPPSPRLDPGNFAHLQSRCTQC
jgi:hypothetical protein